MLALAAGGMDVGPIVIGPHQAELHPAVVGGLEIAQIEAAVEERAVVVVVPIEDEGVDGVVGGGVDLAGHHLRVRLVLVAPERHVRLLMAGKAGPGRLDQLPLRPAAALGLFVARLAGMVVGEIVAGHGDFRRLRGPGVRRERSGGNEDGNTRRQNGFHKLRFHGVQGGSGTFSAFTPAMACPVVSGANQINTIPIK